MSDVAFQYEIPIAYVAQGVLETLAFLAVTVIGLACVRRGLWAVVAVVGGLLGGAASAFYAAQNIQLRWGSSASLFSIEHETLSDLVGWSLAAGIVLVAVAVALLARTTKLRATS